LTCAFCVSTKEWRCYRDGVDCGYFNDDDRPSIFDDDFQQALAQKFENEWNQLSDEFKREVKASSEAIIRGIDR